MGNEAGKNIVLNTQWTAEDVSQFMLKLNENQTKLIFKDREICTVTNIEELLISTVNLYLLNVNVRLIKGAKVGDISAALADYEKKGKIREELQPILKYIFDNKMKGDMNTVPLDEFCAVVGTWIQNFASTMNSL